MNKKFVSALLLGSLVFTAGTFTACSDYDDDINSLNERVDAVEKSVAELKAAIEAGSVITNVESTANGVKVTLSNGKSFELTNGKDGATGATGADGTPGSVVTIGDNGNWFIDGVDTGKPSRGEKGEQGEPGTPGGVGTATPGDYYFPDEDGLWHKYTYDAATGEYKDSGETAGSWKAENGAVTAVYNTEDGILTIGNVDVNGKLETIGIELYASLKSLAVIPDIVDADTKLPVVDFYNILNKKGEVIGSTNVVARYRLNPSNANVNEKLIAWSLIDRTITTRAEGDNENGLLSIEGTPERKVDELHVTLKATTEKVLESLAGNQHPIVALKATNKDNEEEIVSDYITVGMVNLSQFSIINLIPDAAGKDTIFDANAIKRLSTAIPAVGANYDVQIRANKSYDLNEMVNTLAEDMSSATLEGIGVKGLTYEYSMPEEYISDEEDKTNQQVFLNLDGSIITPNAEYGAAVVGRTPIVKVVAKVNGVEIASAYIKVKIVNEETEIKQTIKISRDLGTFEYSELKAGDNVQDAFDWDDMNREVYAVLGLDREGFRQHYQNVSCSAETGAVLTPGDPTGVGVTTDVIDLSFDPSLIADDGKTKTATVTYTSDDQYTYPNVEISFTYSIKHDVKFPEFNNNYQAADGALLVKGKLVSNKWNYSAEVKEQFKDYLVGYTKPGNHDAMYVEKVNLTDPVTITGNGIYDQTIKLNSEIEGSEENVQVRLVIVKANGQKCEKEYTVRFINPFKITAESVSLKTLKTATSEDLKKYVTIKDIDGNVLYQKGKCTDAAAEYGLNANTLKLQFEENFGPQFGDKLTINGGIIKWDNGGNDLQNDLTDVYRVTVTVEDIAIMKGSGKVTVLSTENSK